MISAILNKIIHGKKRPLKRTFKPDLFLTEEPQSTLADIGYVHLKNIVSPKEMEALLMIYEEANNKFSFNTENKNFLNTMALKDSQVKKHIQQATTPVLNKILSRFLNTGIIRFPFGGAFCVNPPYAEQSCKPHQDPAYVNEDETYSIIVWIPLSDINIDNGCIHVLPGSHLWGNQHRSISMDWAFEKFSTELWKYLIPIPVKAGDIICFDAALIHGTNINTTQQNRFAINVPVLPIDQQMITYYPLNNKTGYLFEIDEDYYLDEYLFSKPSDRYANKGKIRLNNNYSINDVARLVNMSSGKQTR